jgi:protein O-GlcNAc transferase
MDFNKAIQLAHDHHLAGNLEQAEDIYKEILNVQRDNADVYNDLGNLLQEQGKLVEAIHCYQKATQINPDFAGAYYNLAETLQDMGRLDEASGYYKKVIELNPDFAGAYYNLGFILQEKRQFDEAMANYLKVLKLTPNDADTCNNIGIVMEEKGLLDSAIAFYIRAIELNPDFAVAYNNLSCAYNKLGVILLEKGQLNEAINNFQRALDFDSNYSDAYYNLGIVLHEKGELDEAIQYYQKAIQINPNFINAYFNLGIALYEQCKQDESIIQYDRAIIISPSNFSVRLAKCISQLPLIYSDQKSIQICRNHYSNELTKMRNTISLETRQDIKAAAEAVGSKQPFYLAYQGFNDRELQKIYGELVTRIMVLRYPQFSECPPMPLHLSDEPLRIGIVSGFFYIHSNWKIPIKGWIENIDKQRFRLYGYYTGKKKDIATEDARRCFPRFVEDIHSFEELCKTIKEDNLHVLIYPEVGMDPTTVRLAALRLAPVQCTSWGHPDTSGLPTIEYFLSSDLMEPPDADDHYSEKLFRLSNLSIFYTPLDFPVAQVNRETFGLRKKSILYLCCQSLFKYLPQYDEIYTRIAKEVGDCQFLFISNSSSYVTEQFRMRIHQSFDKFGLKADDFVVFLPRLHPSQYNAINSLSDIYLDSIGWSGCNSTFEAIAHNLPILTIPGEFMRGRHSSAILTMMRVKETIAATIDEYIELAIKLGKDSDWRRYVSEKIKNNKHLVYRDRTCITGLEDFLERVVNEKLG